MTPTAIGGEVGDGRFWARVRRLADAVVTSSGVPEGFVRRELPTEAGPVAAYAGLAEGGAVGAGATLVVVVASNLEERVPAAVDLGRRFGLTPRQAEVACLLAERRSNKEIARELGIAQHTAWRHTYDIMAKLGTSDRREASRLLLSEDPAAAA